MKSTGIPKTNTGSAAKPLALVAAAAGEATDARAAASDALATSEPAPRHKGLERAVRSATQAIPQHGVLQDNRRKGATSFWIPVRHRSVRLPERPGLAKTLSYRCINTFQEFRTYPTSMCVNSAG